MTQGKFRQKWLENLIKIVAICLKILPPFHPLAQALSSNCHALSITASHWQLPVTEKKTADTLTPFTHINQNTFPALRSLPSCPVPWSEPPPKKRGGKVLHFDFLWLRQHPRRKKNERRNTKKRIINTLESWINQVFFGRPATDTRGPGDKIPSHWLRHHHPGQQNIDKLIPSLSTFLRSSCYHFSMFTCPRVNAEKMFRPAAGGHPAQNFRLRISRGWRKGAFRVEI